MQLAKLIVAMKRTVLQSLCEYVLPSYNRLSPRISLFVCIIAFMVIHQYDAKWNLPILAWYLIGVFAGNGWELGLSYFVILCWLYLWVPLIQGPVLNARLITTFTSLYTIAIYAGYQEVIVYSQLGHLNDRVLSYILPFMLFIISSIVLFKQLKISLITRSVQ